MADGIRRGFGRALGRTAIAGNPSDGYGGAVLAATIPSFIARVVVAAGPTRSRPDTPALIDATIARFARELGGDLLPTGKPSGSPVAVLEWHSSIPPSVGLGGSSAIVIATLRALCELQGVTLAPDLMAELALTIERHDLGIPGGRQDQFAQAFGGLTFMAFTKPPVYEQLESRALPPLLIAWRAATAESSGVVHEGLRGRFNAGVPHVHDGMRELSRLAHRARDAVIARDHAELTRCVDASFDIRAQIMVLNPAHVEMVEIARAAGAGVNYTGSGGAVVCVCADALQRERVARALRDAGCETVAV